MEDYLSCGVDRTESRRASEALLLRYPELSESELIALRTWFKKEASAYDVAVISMNENLASQYRGFRAKYIDPVSLWDIGKFSLIWIGVIAIPVALAILHG